MKRHWQAPGPARAGRRWAWQAQADSDVTVVFGYHIMICSCPSESACHCHTVCLCSIMTRRSPTVKTSESTDHLPTQASSCQGLDNLLSDLPVALALAPLIEDEERRYSGNGSSTI
eukprot:1776069-Rhodomonas_salina.1